MKLRTLIIILGLFCANMTWAYDCVLDEDGDEVGDGTSGALSNAGSTQLACGNGATATEINSTAVGNAAEATNISSTAVGVLAKATGTNSTAVGVGVDATGTDSTAVGVSAQARSDDAVLLMS